MPSTVDSLLRASSGNWSKELSPLKSLTDNSQKHKPFLHQHLSVTSRIDAVNSAFGLLSTIMAWLLSGALDFVRMTSSTTG